MREGVIPHFVAIVSDSSEEFALLILSARCLLIAPDYKECGLYTEASESIEYVLRGGLRPIVEGEVNDLALAKCKCR
jgi:hypothetical protein